LNDYSISYDAANQTYTVTDNVANRDGVDSITGVETFNYQKRVPLEKMCYDFHSDSEEKLSCCLKAGYIWQEGFSYFEDIPLGCKKYMNWNE